MAGTKVRRSLFMTPPKGSRAKYRRNKRRAVPFSKLGYPAGTQQSKKDDLVTNVTSAVNYNNLYATDVTALVTDVGPAGAGDPRANINKRLRNNIYLGGVQWKQTWSNSIEFPMVIRWAIVSPTTNQVTNIPTGMFKAFNASRDQDFANTMSSLEKQTFPLSTDRLTVYYEGKLYLGGKSGGAPAITDRDGQNHVSIDKYFPLKRQVRYNDDSTQDCESKVFCIWWATPYMQSTTSSTAGLNTQTSLVTYFREPGEYVMSKLGVLPVGQPRPIYVQQNFKTF